MGGRGFRSSLNQSVSCSPSIWVRNNCWSSSHVWYYRTISSQTIIHYLLVRVANRVYWLHLFSVPGCRMEVSNIRHCHQLHVVLPLMISMVWLFSMKLENNGYFVGKIIGFSLDYFFFGKVPQFFIFNFLKSLIFLIWVSNKIFFF